MGNIDQERLNLLFEMESIKTPLVNYIHPGVNIKVIADLGYKDSNGMKRRFYEENRYTSNKYKNTDHLISSTFRINTYLAIEYPNINYEKGNGELPSKAIIIRGYAMDELITKIRYFTNELVNAYKFKNTRPVLLSDKAITVTCFPSKQDIIEISPDIYNNKYTNSQEVGVRIVLNKEYSFVISGETTWLDIVYKISRCDLTLLGIQMVQSYMSLLPGMAVNEFGKGFNSTKRFKPYNGDDPDDIVNNSNSVKVNSKPNNRKERIHNFFDDID